MKDTKPLLITIPQAATMLGVSVGTVKCLLSKNEIPSIKIGWSRRIPTAALHEYVRRKLEA